jgi:hypothetical protein
MFLATETLQRKGGGFENVGQFSSTWFLDKNLSSIPGS